MEGKFVVLKQNPPVHMRQSAHKDILNFLQQVIPEARNDQMRQRFCLMNSLIQECIRNGRCGLESLSEATDAYQTQKKSSLLQQSKR